MTDELTYLRYFYDFIVDHVDDDVVFNINKAFKDKFGKVPNDYQIMGM